MFLLQWPIDIENNTMVDCDTGVYIKQGEDRKISSVINVKTNTYTNVRRKTYTSK